MINDKFKEWWFKCDDSEKCIFLKQKAIQLNKYHVSMTKSLKAELEHGFNRTGKRGGKFTTLNAKSQNNTRMYLSCLDELQYMAARM